MKYEVEVYRHIQESCYVTVEADDEDAAEEAAIEASHSLPDSAWRRGPVTDMGTFDCNKVQEGDS